MGPFRRISETQVRRTRALELEMVTAREPRVREISDVVVDRDRKCEDCSTVQRCLNRVVPG